MAPLSPVKDFGKFRPIVSHVESGVVAALQLKGHVQLCVIEMVVSTRPTGKMMVRGLMIMCCSVAGGAVAHPARATNTASKKLLYLIRIIYRLRPVRVRDPTPTTLVGFALVSNISPGLTESKKLECIFRFECILRLRPFIRLSP